MSTSARLLSTAPLKAGEPSASAAAVGLVTPHLMAKDVAKRGSLRAPLFLTGRVASLRDFETSYKLADLCSHRLSFFFFFPPSV